MARSRTADPGGEMTADEQAQMAAMQAADNEPEAPEAPAPVERAAPAPQAPPEPEATDDEDPAAAPAQRADRTVPLAALIEERNARKEMERQLRLLEDRTNLLFQQRQQPAAVEPPKPQEPPIPEVDKDPVGHIVGMQAAQQQRLEAYARDAQQRDALAAQASQIAALQARATALEADFQSKTPDYAEAVKHLQARRHAELALIGFNDPAIRHQTILQEGLGLAHRALQDGRNPAEIIYALAKERGYAPPAAATEAMAPAAPDATQRMQQLAAGQQQARSIGNARGTAPAPLNAARLISMSEAEFAKMMDTPEGIALLGA